MKFVVTVASVALVVVLVAKVLVWAEALVNMLVEGLVIDVRADTVIGVLTDVEIIVVGVIVIVLKLEESVSYSVYAMSGAEVDLLMDEFAGVLADIILGVLSGTGDDVFVDVNVNVFAGVATVRFGISAPLERFSC